jgi:hypothetical protein
MRYFLDAEFNGFGGALISIALTPEDAEAAAFYEALDCLEPEGWTLANILPVLKIASISRARMTAKLAEYLKHDPAPVVIADWPEDIAHLAMLMVTGPGFRTPSPRFVFELLDLPLFDSQASSKVPHNAYHDAVALRAYVQGRERLWPPGASPEGPGDENGK